MNGWSPRSPGNLPDPGRASASPPCRPGCGGTSRPPEIRAHHPEIGFPPLGPRYQAASTASLPAGPDTAPPQSMRSDPVEKRGYRAELRNFPVCRSNPPGTGRTPSSPPRDPPQPEHGCAACRKESPSLPEVQPPVPEFLSGVPHPCVPAYPSVPGPYDLLFSASVPELRSPRPCSPVEKPPHVAATSSIFPPGRSVRLDETHGSAGQRGRACRGHGSTGFPVDGRDRLPLLPNSHGPPGSRGNGYVGAPILSVDTSGNDTPGAPSLACWLLYFSPLPGFDPGHPGQRPIGPHASVDDGPLRGQAVDSKSLPGRTPQRLRPTVFLFRSGKIHGSPDPRPRPTASRHVRSGMDRCSGALRILPVNGDDAAGP